MDVGSVEGVTPDALISFLSSHQGEDHGDSVSTLVVDCRPFMAYNAGHIVESVNVHCPPILKRRSGGFVALENIVVDAEKRGRLQRGCYSRLVLYDQSTDSLPASDDRDSNLYSVLKSVIQQLPNQRVCYLLGGYDAFSQDCPLLCVTQQFSPLNTTGRLEAPHAMDTSDAGPGTCEMTSTDGAGDEEPVEMLPHVLLGCGRHAAGLDLLQRLGVTAVVNASTSCPNHFPQTFRYLHVPVRDSACEDLASWFATTNQFIDEVRQDGGRVLVHCQAGRSRSATVVLAYLIHTLDLSLDAAFEHVRSRRQVIDPNLNFMRQLQSYRQRLDAEKERQGPPSSPSMGESGSADVPTCSASSSSASAPAPLRLSLKSSSLSLDLQSGGGRPSSSGSTFSFSGGSAFSFSGGSAFNYSGCGPFSPVLSLPSPTAPISLPSASHDSLLPPAYSAADQLSLCPSPATASDVHCFFNFSNFSTSEFPFPSGSLARTPEIPLPS